MSMELLGDAVAERELGLLDRSRLPALAVELLVNDIESPALVRLAGANSAPTAELDELLSRAAAELSVRSPTGRDAVGRLARRIAHDVLDGQIDAREATARVWRLTRAWDGEPLPELDTFVYAASEWDERPEDSAIFTEGVLAAAHELVAGDAP